MAIRIKAIDSQKQLVGIDVDNFPNKCPICRYSIEPCFVVAHCDGERLKLVFKCPRIECKYLFLSIYSYSSATDDGWYHYSYPEIRTEREFKKLIQDISEKFCEIYNESFSAEQLGLLKICGVGYRKALEFLIKDYLIKLQPNNEEEIKSKFLGKCITDDIKNENIKQIAKRAVWLGNDETHYVRVWQNKDLQDLKKLIDITVSWIEIEETTKEVIQDMQNP